MTLLYPAFRNGCNDIGADLIALKNKLKLFKGVIAIKFLSIKLVFVNKLQFVILIKIIENIG